MPTIAYLFEYPTLSGGERSMLTVLPHVRAAGFDLLALAPPRGPLAEALAEQGVEVVPFGEEHLPGAGAGPLRSTSVRRGQLAKRPSLEQRRERLAQILTKRPVDLLHANSLAMGRLSGPVAADHGLPSVAHLRDIVRLSRAALDDLGRHRACIAVSEATRRFHREQGLARSAVHVLYNGVDLERFRPAAATGALHRELGVDESRLLVACIGQLVLRKGTDVFLEAARRLVEAERPGDGRSRAHFLVVGERWSVKDEARRFEEDLHAAANRGALAGRCRFLGGRDDVLQVLHESALLVHAARQEPLGRVLLEAAACGTAVVATDAGGTREIFPDGASGLVVPIDDAPAIAAAARSLLENPGARERLGRAARARAEAAFAAPVAAARLVELYRLVATD